MPVIPLEDEGQRLDTTPPINLVTDSENARRPGEDLAKVGTALSKFGADVGDVVAKQDEAKRIADTNEAKNKVENIAKANFDQTLQGPGDDYVSDYNSAAQPDVNDYVNKIQDPRVREAAASYAQDLHRNFSTTLFRQQLRTNEERIVKTTADGINASSDRVYQEPTTAALEMKTLTNELLDPLEKTGAVSPEKRLELEKAAQNTVATSMINGMLDKKNYRGALNLLRSTVQPGEKDIDTSIGLSADDALNMNLVTKTKYDQMIASGETYQMNTLDGKKQPVDPELAKVLQGLSPKEREHFMGRIQSEIQTNEGVRVSDASRQANDVAAFALNGGDPKIAKAQMGKVINNIAGIQTISGEAKKGMIDNMNMAVIAGGLTRQAQLASPDQFGKIMEQARSQILPGGDSNLFNYARRSQMVDTIEQNLNQNLKERLKDPAGYVVENVPSISNAKKASADGDPSAARDYISQNLKTQEKLGVPPSAQKVLPNSDSVRIGQQFQVARTGEDVVNQIQSLQGKYGDYTGRIIAEAAGKNPEIQSMGILAHINEPTSQRDIANNIINKKQINEAWAKAAPQSEKYFQNQVQNAILPKVSGLANTALNMRNALSDATTIEAKRLMVTQPQLYGNDKSGILSAAADASKNIIDKNFSQAAGGQSTVLIPKYNGTKAIDSGLVSGFMQTYSDPKNFEKLGIAKSTGGDPMTAYKDMAPRMKWQVNASMTGLSLMYNHPDPSVGMIPAVNAQNQPITRTFDQIQKENLKAQRGMFPWSK